MGRDLSLPPGRYFLGISELAGHHLVLKVDRDSAICLGREKPVPCTSIGREKSFIGRKDNKHRGNLSNQGRIILPRDKSTDN